jgi:hypothetical protein
LGSSHNRNRSSISSACTCTPFKLRGLVVPAPSNTGAGAGVLCVRPFGANKCGEYESSGVCEDPETERLPGLECAPISAAAVKRAIGEGWGLRSAGCDARSLRRRFSDSRSSSESRLNGDQHYDLVQEYLLILSCLSLVALWIHTCACALS